MTKVLTSIILTLAVSGASCKDNERTEVANAPTKTTQVYRPEYVTAFNSSKVLVLPQENGNFTFYRDKDNDGYADTRGTGVYLAWGSGLSNIFSEVELPHKRYRMEEFE